MENPRHDQSHVSRTVAGRQENIFFFPSSQKNVLDFSSCRSRILRQLTIPSDEVIALVAYKSKSETITRQVAVSAPCSKKLSVTMPINDDLNFLDISYPKSFGAFHTIRACFNRHGMFQQLSGCGDSRTRSDWTLTNNHAVVRIPDNARPNSAFGQYFGAI
jgi:hypothetical protein